MAGGINLATKYAKQVDERFYRESQAVLALSDNYEFKGDKTVKIFSIPTAPLVNYTRSGTSRYGTPDDLARNVQTMTVDMDMAFSYVIDRGDFIQSEYVMQSGESLAREIRDVIVPFFDSYVFAKLAKTAKDNDNYASTAITKSNAYQYFLKGMEFLGNHNVPDKGRVCFCSYAFANFMKQDSAFMRYGDLSQEMINKGIIGEVDGCQIVKVPASRLPSGASFILTHKDAAIAPKQLEEYKEHDNPPGISGKLVEGRIIFDCFVFDEKVNAIYYHGGQAVLKELDAYIVEAASGQNTITVNGMKEASTNKRYFLTATTKAGLPTVTYGSAIDITTSTAPWYGATEITGASNTFTPTASHTWLRVVEVGSDMKPIAMSDVKLKV
jgi:hypothetical protein